MLVLVTVRVVVVFRILVLVLVVVVVFVTIMIVVVVVSAPYTVGMVHRVYTAVDRIHASRSNSSREDLRNSYANFLAKIPICLHSSELAFNCFRRS